jgi:DNA-binding NtrC family response regulator
LKNIIPHNIQHGDVLYLEGIEKLEKEELDYLQQILDRMSNPEKSNGEQLPNFRLIVSTSTQAENPHSSKHELTQLFESLSQLELRIDPIRLRKYELKGIIHAVFEKIKKEKFSHAEMISEELCDMLIDYNWPLNFDELHIVIECLLLTCRELVLLPKHLHQLDFSDIAHTKYPTLDDMVEEHIKKALRVTMGNKSKAAKMLGITPKTLYARIRN